MTDKKIRSIGALLVLAVWLVLTVGAWFLPPKEMSESERRPLDQFPNITVDTVLSGKFMSAFEDYTLDQFPGRDLLRRLKSLFHYNVMNQSDNNDIYIADGYAAKLEYPLSDISMNNAISIFNNIRQKYLRANKMYFAIVPDKGYYLAEKNGYLAMDYEKLFSTMEKELNWATFIDLTDVLSVEDYYFTDTHWRQEKLIPAAQKIAQAMKIPGPTAESFTQTKLERPFYGVYYGQAALPMDAEPLYIMESEILKNCTVYNHETGETTAVYDMSKLESKDLYDVYLSGAQAMLTITNPAVKSNKELIVFRDSFGSSMVPLLVQDYRTVTVVDIRYADSNFLNRYIQFRNQDVLFLYSSLILNSSSVLK
jgi:hypothetical protein